jgi:hypothetical protein
MLCAMGLICPTVTPAYHHLLMSLGSLSMMLQQTDCANVNATADMLGSIPCASDVLFHD